MITNFNELDENDVKISAIIFHSFYIKVVSGQKSEMFESQT